MAVTLVRTGLADKIKTVAGEGRDEFSGRQRMKAAVIHGHC
jgi:hypothetical protein